MFGDPRGPGGCLTPLPVDCWRCSWGIRGPTCAAHFPGALVAPALPGGRVNAQPAGPGRAPFPEGSGSPSHSDSLAAQGVLTLTLVLPQVKTGLIMNVIGVFCVFLAINTWGRVIFDLDRFPAWANVTNIET